MVICSSIGAGIFIKNHEILADVHGAIIYAIIPWLVAIMGIIALTFALVEICSGSGENNNQGIVGWVRKFNSKFLYMGTKNFMTWLHLPIYFFILPMYLVMTLQEGFGFSMSWWGVLLIVLAISSYFIIVSGISAKMANIHSHVTMLVKVLPILFATITGFMMLGFGKGGDMSWTTSRDEMTKHTYLFADQNIFMGIMCAVPAVFFAFDGFYAAAGIQTSMREPRKVSMAMALGVSIVSLIDILITLSLVLGTNSGKMVDLQVASWMLQIAQLCVAIGILGIINGFAIYAGRYYNELVITNEIPFAKKLKKWLKPNSFFLGVIIAEVIFVIFTIVFGLVGAYAFINTGHYGIIPGWDGGNNGKETKYYDSSQNTNLDGNFHLCTLYSFADLIGNWNAVLAFLCIVFAVIGCLINRKTNRTKVIKTKSFLPGAIVCTIVVSIVMIFTCAKAIGDFVFILGYYFNGSPIDKFHPNTPGYDNNGNPITISDVIGGVMQIVVAIGFLSIMFIPAFIRDRMDNKKGIHKYSHALW